MPVLQLAAWVAMIGGGAVIVAFVAAEAFLYFLRTRNLARIAREPGLRTPAASQVAAATGGPGANVALSTGAPLAARVSGAIARRPATSPPGPVAGPPK